MVRRYFIGGFTWKGESQKDRFIKDGIWENGYDEKYDEVYKKIRVGDFIGLKSTYLKQGKSYLRIYTIGIVTEFSTEKMKLKVDWSNKHVQKDITDITWYADTLCEIVNKEHIFKIFGMNDLKEQVLTFSSLLSANRNLILTGAPGTGKTYLAKQIAKAMGCTDNEIGFVQFHPSYDYTDFVEGLRPLQDDSGNVGFERKDGVFKEFCKNVIKSSYSNSIDNFDDAWKQFIAALSANANGQQIPTITGSGSFTVELNQNGDGLIDIQPTYNRYYNYDQLYNVYRGLPGVQKGGHDNYRKAVIRYLEKNYGLQKYKSDTYSINGKKHVFIIDEINRGEINKIFGELFFSIDPGYRGTDGKVKTQYQNLVDEDDEFYEGFFVPKNVYIIGTMNDIDRSVESMDFAFRRRFAFKEIKAMDRVEMLDELPQKEIAINRMKNLNKAIEGIEGLSAAYHIGPAYFLKLKNYNGNFQQLWDNHLEGLLREYLRGMQNLEENLKTLKAAYDNESDSANGQQQE